MFIELTNYGNPLTEAEVWEVLEHAPYIKQKSLDDPKKIDYPALCRMLSGVIKKRPTLKAPEK